MTSSLDAFAALHTPGNPVLLYNVWDAGSARAVAAAGAPALATGSHSLAGAMGFADGENIPFNLFLDCVRRIVAAINVRITQVNSRTTSGPPSSTMPLNVDRVIEEWRKRRG